MTHEQGLSLWLTYNHILLWQCDTTEALPLVEFSEDATDVNRQFRSLADSLGLDGSAMSFFDDAMRRPTPPRLVEREGAGAALTLFERLRSRRTFPSAAG